MKKPDEPFDVRSPQTWLLQAQSDLNLARGARQIEDVLPEHLAFHAQQCAEKAIKAVLLSRNMQFLPTHNIQALIDLCEKGGLAIPEILEESVELTPYAVEGRYLELAEPVSESDANHAIELAAEVLKWAETQI
jgi:HEPN domain-containing protein